MPLRLKPVARSLSARAEFFGLELEDWGFVIAWAIAMRLIGDQIHRVLLGFMPLSSAAPAVAVLPASTTDRVSERHPVSLSCRSGIGSPAWTKLS